MQENGIKEVIEQGIWENIKSFLDYRLVDRGSESEPIIITVGLLLLFLLVIVLTNIILKGTKMLATRKMSPSDTLKMTSIFGFVRYFLYIVIFLNFLSAAGINILVVLTASAALFVGLGLAMRELFQDIIGGIAVMIDQSLHAGDIIEIDGKVGRVIDIKLRTTRALTRDDKVIVIPNHKLISDVVYNYTQNHQSTREAVFVRAPIGVDSQLIKDLLLECAREQNGIVDSPEPFVLFEEFEESALRFGIYFYIANSFVDPKIKSELRFRIYDRFREHHIDIPFPQRDIHFTSNQEIMEK